MWVLTGSTNSLRDCRRYIPIHELSKSLSPLLANILPAVHALTGYDTISAIFGFGKKTVFKLVRKSPSKFTNLQNFDKIDFSTSLSATRELISSLTGTLHQVLTAWLHVTQILKQERHRDMLVSIEHWTITTLQNSFTQWREHLLTQRAQKASHKKLVRNAWKIWKIQWETNVHERIEIEGKIRHDVLQETFETWKDNVARLKRRRHGAEVFIQRALVRQVIEAWHEHTSHRKMIRAVAGNLEKILRLKSLVVSGSDHTKSQSEVVGKYGKKYITPANGMNTAKSPWKQYFRKQYMGCIVDQASPRTLPYGKLDLSTMTNDLCESHCCSFLRDATYMGTQAWSQCFCTNVTSSDNFVPRPPTYCDMPCNGNSSEVCGGSWSLSVYKIECLTDTTIDTYSPSSSYIPSVTTDITTDSTTESTTDVLKLKLTSTVADRYSECSCANCLQINSTVWTTEELAEKLTLLKNAIFINKKETKSYKATKISAYDPRKSSRNIGMVGIALLIVPVIFAIVMDIQRIFK
ncbi:unnamed protein product [Mytilus edulis]|uniref:WSC domain-containing protein n=1 Tax=Mytilus edulis TaxID=6550 RepID=A0A8S3PQY7_MYTED|nr:unnamed protein product [Mytilus edulis]